MMKAMDRVGNIAAIRPNWNSPVRETVSYSTEIITSQLGIEQRVSNRSKPRFSFSFSVMATDSYLAQIRADLDNKQNELWIMPVWYRHVSVAAPILINDDTILLTSIPDWLVVGSLFVVAGSKYEAFVVSDITGTLVTVIDPAQAQHDQFSFVYDAEKCYYPSELNWRNVTSNVWSTEVEMTSNTKSDVLKFPNDDLRYAGRDLLMIPPNWSFGTEYKPIMERDYVDYQRGVDVFSPSEHSRSYIGYTLSGYSDKIDKAIAIFKRCRGRRLAVWSPTWQMDFNRIVSFPSGAYQMIVPGKHMMPYAGSLTHDRVIVRYADSYQINKIVSITELGDDTLFTFENSWANEVGVGTPIHWLLKTRFASDDLTINRMSSDVSSVQIGLITLRTDEG